MIEWCNYNSGFVSAVLALSGLIISVVAIFVSISTARIPYKKKVVLSVSTELKYDERGGTHCSHIAVIFNAGYPKFSRNL